MFFFRFCRLKYCNCATKCADNKIHNSVKSIKNSFDDRRSFSTIKSSTIEEIKKKNLNRKTKNQMYNSRLIYAILNVCKFYSLSYCESGR